MTQQNYAFIKNGIVTNVAVFDDLSEELFNIFKLEFELDDLVLATEKAVIGGTWDGVKFTTPSPYPSWILNEFNDWIAPVEIPVNENKFYTWNEENVSWDEHDAIISIDNPLQ